MRYAVIAMAVLLTGCMDPTLSDTKFDVEVQAEGEWTMRIDAEYADGWKTHLVPGEGNEVLNLAPVIGTEQQQWSATFNTDVTARVLYDGEIVHDGKLLEGDAIVWP